MDQSGNNTLGSITNGTTTTAPSVNNTTCVSTGGSTNNVNCQIAKLLKEYHNDLRGVTFLGIRDALETMEWHLGWENQLRNSLKEYIQEQTLKKKLVIYSGNARIEDSLNADLNKLKNTTKFVPHAIVTVASLGCHVMHLFHVVTELSLRRTGIEIQDELEEQLKLSKNQTLEKSVEEDAKSFERIDFESVFESKMCDFDILERRMNESRVVKILGAWIEGDKNKTIYTDLSTREKRLIQEMKSFQIVYDNDIEKASAKVLGRPDPAQPIVVPAVMNDKLRLVLQKANFLTEAIFDSNTDILARMTDLHSSNDLILNSSIKNISRLLVVSKMLDEISTGDKFGREYLEAQLRIQEDLVISDQNKTHDFSARMWIATYKFKLIPLAALKAEVDQELDKLLQEPDGQQHRMNFGPEIELVRSTNFPEVGEDIAQNIQEMNTDKETLRLRDLRNVLLDKLKNNSEKQETYRYFVNLIKNLPDFSEFSKSMTDYETELRKVLEELSAADRLKLHPINSYHPAAVADTSSSTKRSSKLNKSKKLRRRKIKKPMKVKRINISDIKL